MPHHSKDLRKGRYSEPGRGYLVTTTTYKRQPVFQDLACGRAMVRVLREACERGMATSQAFVVMPDHLHWLLVLGERATLPRLVGWVKGTAARRINRMLGAKGKPFWQDGYHDHALRRDEDILDVARYVVANPLRSGLVQRLGDYPLWDAAWL